MPSGSRSWRVPSPSHRSYVFGAGPRGVHAPPGPLFQLVAAERRWTEDPSQGLAQTFTRTSCCPRRCPMAVFGDSAQRRKPRKPLPKRDSANAPDRIRTCDLRFRRTIRPLPSLPFWRAVFALNPLLGSGLPFRRSTPLDTALRPSPPFSEGRNRGGD